MNKALLIFYFSAVYVRRFFMKELSMLKIEDLTLEQKLGMLDALFLSPAYSDKEKEYAFDLIRRRSLGAIWIQQSTPGAFELVKKVREIADYPILIITDAESGMCEYKIGNVNAIGCTGNESMAYAFGKALAVTARSIGYSVVCSPVIDSRKNGSPRQFGSNVREVARLGGAMARGMQDGGILTVAKHYPSGDNPKRIDSHMAEGYSEQTREQLLEEGLYPYRKLMEEGLLDGIMTGHHRFVNIDNTRPASLSKPVIDIIRELGFDGFLITDSLGMRGVSGRFGQAESNGLSIAAGNDLALSCKPDMIFRHEAIISCYKQGMFDEARLNDAVRHVLNAQAKAMREPKYTSLTNEEINMAKNIDLASIYAQCDKGITLPLSRDKRHLFALMTRNENAIGIDGKVEVDTFSSSWQNTTAITEKILESFPSSSVMAFHQFPNNVQICNILGSASSYDDVVFITFAEPIAYTGPEHLTRRAECLINSAQSTGIVSALIHYGNPCVLEDLAHIPRVIIGGLSVRSNLGCIDVLAGDLEASGTLTYEAKIN